jgi:ZIP family zinc transporter/zinc and cadmium transporter
MDLTSPFALSLAFGAAAAAANVVGGLVVVARRHWNEMFLKYFVGLGAGFMLAATFLRMMPASFALSSSAAPALILAGYFLVQFFEHTLAPHFHFGEERHDEVMMNPAVGISALVGLSIHTFFDGVSIASGFLISAPLGLLIFFAVVLHKIPEGVTVASIALASGRGKRGALTAAFVLAGATMAGVLGMNQFTGAIGYALPLSTGVTLYVAASDLIPEVNEERGLRMPLIVFLGVALFYVTEHLLDAFTA